MVPNNTRLLANSNIPDPLQMLQCKSNVPACFKPYFRVLCLFHFRVTNTELLQLQTVLRQCGEMSKSPKTTPCVKFRQKNSAEAKTNCWSQQGRRKQQLSQWRHPLANWHPLHLPLPTAAGSFCCVEYVWNVMVPAQKPDLVFQGYGRVHFNWRGRQFSRLLAVEVCASAVVMLDTPCSEVECKTTGYPLHSHVSPSLPLPCVTVCHQVSTVLYRRLLCAS